VFIDDGLTLENPDPERAGYDPELYGDRWSPVLISWTDPVEDPRLASQTIGVGGSVWLEYTGRSGYEKPKRLYVSGTISLDGPQFAESPAGTRAMQAAVIQHELGHLLGLNDIDDPTQLMYKERKLCPHMELGT
jgi:hypothetical protein